MFVEVNGARLYVDVEGAGLVADGKSMRSKPTLVLLHGGPGGDHSIYKPGFGCLSDIAQIVYVDHRGNGRSGGNDPATWTLDQWGDDVRGLCDALGIEKPIVYGASFGGLVAQAYATRHPDHVGKLILTSTAAHVEFEQIYAAFERLGGAESRSVATAYWSNPTGETRAAYIEKCVPLYSFRSSSTAPDWLARTIMRNDVALHFNGPHNEQGRMNFRDALARLSCPVLVMAGESDPIMPIEFSEVLVARLLRARVEFRRFTECGHGVVGDQPDAAFRAIREFILDAS